MRTLIFFLSVCLCIGCDLAAPKGKITQTAPSPTASPEPPAEKPESGTSEKPAESASQPEEKKTNDKDNNNEDNGEEKKAGVGAGKQGHYGATGGKSAGDILLVPLEAHFRAKERIVFLQIDDALKKYRAEHDGKGPATHKEFMSEIIEPAQIKLPPLHSGEEYRWNPKADDGKGDLMIRKKKEN